MSEPVPEPTPAKRITSRDLIEQLQRTVELLTTRSREPDASVEFTRNSKGETQIAVKVSAPGGTSREQLAELADAVLEQAKATYEAATRAYPSASGFATNQPAGATG